MTHFIVTSIGTFGDIYPYAQVALGLKNLGYKTTFITNPYFEEFIAQCGLDFHPLGTKNQYLDVIQNDKLWDDKSFLEVTLNLFLPNINGISDYISQCSTDEKFIILAHQNLLVNCEMARIQHQNKVTVICGALYPSVFGEEEKSENVQLPNQKKFSDSPLIAPVNIARQKIGLTPISSYKNLFTDIASFNVLFFSDWFGNKEKHWPDNLINGEFIYNESLQQEDFPDSLKHFLKSNRKPILFTFGTGNLHCQDQFKYAQEIAEKLNYPAIFICKDKNIFPKNLPDSILTLEYCKNFQALLKECSLIVHHGGIGTLAEAARAGTPQVIIPSLGDQWDNSARVQRLQLGLSIPGNELNSSKLFDAVNTIFESATIRNKCAELSLEITERIHAADIAKNIVKCLSDAKVLD